MSSDNTSNGHADAEPRSNVIEQALQTWVEIDLPSLQKKLDEQGVEIKEYQKESLLSRKNLASKTKEFRKLDDSKKLEQIKSLLKLYQNEIDSLTNKNKNVENYFFGIYRLMAEAPDPRPLMELSLDSVVESKEAMALKESLTKAEEELAKRADYEQLKQRLLLNEQKAAELLSIKVKAKENECKSLFEEKEANWKDKEKQFEEQLRTAQKQIEELRTSNEVTERRLDNQSKGHDNTNYETASASVLAELDMVRRDAELSKRRIYELEKRNETLRHEIAQTKNDNEIQVVRSECDQKVSEVESENMLLVANLNQIRNQKEQISSQLNSKIDSLSRENSVIAQEVKNLKTKLEKTSDYEEIKHELHILRQIEFGHGEDNEDNEDGEVDKVGENDTVKHHAKLDSIVIERNRAMTQELARFRAEHNDLTNAVDELNIKLQRSEEEIQSLRQLNEKLENDLANVQESGSHGWGFNDSGSMISGFTSRMGGRSSGGRNGSIVSLQSSDRGTNNGPNDDASSILPIITKQRDRFREKNTELEEELRKQFNANNDMKRQINKLRQDNEELYERGRYLQSFQTPGTRNITTTSSGRKFLNPKPNANADLESNNDIQYQKEYERKLHPIEQFRIKEQERINSRLSPLERFFIFITRAVLATRSTRMVFFAYCLCLHIIVLWIMIYAMNLRAPAIPDSISGTGANVARAGTGAGIGAGIGAGTGGGGIVNTPKDTHF